MSILIMETKTMAAYKKEKNKCAEKGVTQLEVQSSSPLQIYTIYHVHPHDSVMKVVNRRRKAIA